MDVKKLIETLGSKLRGIPGSKQQRIPVTKVKMKVTNTRPVYSASARKPLIIVINKKQLITVVSIMAAITVLGFSLPGLLNKPSDSTEGDHLDMVVPPRETEVDMGSLGETGVIPEEDEAPPVERDNEDTSNQMLPVIDLSQNTVAMNSDMLRINEPTPWGREVLYSAGNASSIDEPVLTKLFLYNQNTQEEKVIAETQVKFGEIYEGRLNSKWIVWLDTNQQGTNYIKAYNRETGEELQVKKCNLNKPQLRLYGNNLLWVEQKDSEQDRLYLYNFMSGEPVSLESFNNATYGVCPPMVYNDVAVWVYPNQDDPNYSIIKRLDLRKALMVKPPEMYWDPESQTYVVPEDSPQGAPAPEENVEPEIIDPKGFAMYPSTNGQAIAWLDSLNPSAANLMMTVDGQGIIAVAEDVGRFFGIGQNFVVYTQDQSIMVYFWETGQYGRITKPGQKGRLSKASVAEDTVIWYDATNANQTKDVVMITTIPENSVQ